MTILNALIHCNITFTLMHHRRTSCHQKKFALKNCFISELVRQWSDRNWIQWCERHSSEFWHVLIISAINNVFWLYSISHSRRRYHQNHHHHLFCVVPSATATQGRAYNIRNKLLFSVKSIVLFTCFVIAIANPVFVSVSLHLINYFVKLMLIYIVKGDHVLRALLLVASYHHSLLCPHFQFLLLLMVIYE